MSPQEHSTEIEFEVLQSRSYFVSGLKSIKSEDVKDGGAPYVILSSFKAHDHNN
jgi:hypothetical protein